MSAASESNVDWTDKVQKAMQVLYPNRYLYPPKRTPPWMRESTTSEEVSAIWSSEELKMHLYKKTLKATLYPISPASSHNFTRTSVLPAACHECEGLLWGRQGAVCDDCGVMVHDRLCRDSLNVDCLQRTTEKNLRRGRKDRANGAIAAMQERMTVRLCEKRESFGLIHSTFSADEDASLVGLTKARQLVVADANRLRKISVTVIRAREFNSVSKLHSYVTVQVGKTKSRTSLLLNDLDPERNETLVFECRGSSERMRIKLWREHIDLISKVNTYVREGDNFLGQTAIEARTLSGEMDVWYDLFNGKAELFGAIELHIRVEAEEEANLPSRYDQYACLHEKLFDVLWENEEGAVKLPRTEHFDPPAQDVLDEFAACHGIERIFRDTTHFYCLAKRVACHAGVPAAMIALLNNIHSYYSRGATGPMSISNRFTVSNLNSRKFAFLLSSLQKSLRADFCEYRLNFPSASREKLMLFKSLVDLRSSVSSFSFLFFRREVSKDSFHYTNSVLKDCIVASVKSTYRSIFQNCEAIHSRMFPERNYKEPYEDANFPRFPAFWLSIVDIMTSFVEEDRNVYTHLINQFPQEVNIGRLSAATFWQLFAADFADAYDEFVQSNRQSDDVFKSDNHKYLYVKVKRFFTNYVQETSPYKDRDPAYLTWFRPHLIELYNQSEVSLEN